MMRTSRRARAAVAHLLLAVALLLSLGADWGTGRELPEGLPVPAAAQPAVDRATADLAARRGLEPAAIAVVLVEAVEWPDGSLGCPEPGRAYPQVITPGWRILLQAAGETVAYHANAAGTVVVLCPRPRP